MGLDPEGDRLAASKPVTGTHRRPPGDGHPGKRDRMHSPHTRSPATSAMEPPMRLPGGSSSPSGFHKTNAALTSPNATRLAPTVSDSRMKPNTRHRMHSPRTRGVHLGGRPWRTPARIRRSRAEALPRAAFTLEERRHPTDRSPRSRFHLPMYVRESEQCPACSVFRIAC
jgi:hypothetical protein